MSSRIEAQFGAVKDLSTTYTQVGSAVASGHLHNVHLNVTNSAATARTFRAFIADTSWSSGEPTGSTKFAAICFDLPIAVGQLVQITGVILSATQELVVWSSGAGIDVIASGVDITL